MTTSPRVLVTGASSGIGLATALLFARHGWRVVGAVRDTARKSELQGELERSGLSAEIVAFDIGDRQACDRAIEAVLAEGDIDALINNAGVAVFGPLEHVNDDEIDLQFEINVVAPLRLIRSVLPHMRQRGRGTILNISSASGFVSPAFEGLYAASKHALEALSEALEGEVRPFGIRVAIIEPGSVATPIKGKIVTPAGYDTSSPYRARHRRVTARLAETLWAGGWAETPESVAASIWEAVTTETPRLRWVVGRDALLVAELRGREAVDAFPERLASALEAMRPPSNGA